MKYIETTTHHIEYSFEDIMLWVKTFAAKQFGMSSDEITEEHISFFPNDIKDKITIKVQKSKSSSNQKI